MATIIYDGTNSQTVAKTDTVFLTANPAQFTSAAESNGNVVLTFGTNSLTVTGTTLTPGGLPGVSTPGGSFAFGTTGTYNTSGNTLVFSAAAGTTTIGGNNTTSSTISAAFGGLGRSDSLDTAETISIASASKGSYLIYGNAGADSISAAANNLDSNTATTVFGGRGSDTINFGIQGANSASTNFAIYGGEDGDSININHKGTGSLTIFGGTAAADSTDGADSIALGTATVGTINVYAGAGADIITSTGGAGGASATFADGAVGNFFGGNGNDTITVGGNAKATITVYGGADADSIAVANLTGGTSTVYGGTGAADPTDGGDSLTVTGGGTFVVYGDGGNDVITATGITAATDSSTTLLTVFGGRGDDNIQAGSTTVKANLALYGSENNVENSAGDTIAAANATGGSTIVYGGTAAADAADGKDSITITGQGTVTVYAAGGDDTVDLTGANTAVSTATDSLNAITVFGGGGNDSIALGTQVSNTGSGVAATAGQGTITIDGGAGNDSISIISDAANAATTSTGVGITINNFAIGAAGDKLLINNGAATNTVVTVDGSTVNTLQAALDLAASNATAGQVAAVIFQGNAYVVVDNDTGTTFSQTADLAIKLTGITGTVSDVAAAIVVS